MDKIMQVLTSYKKRGQNFIRNSRELADLTIRNPYNLTKFIYI